jgi:DNA polymerase III epsilon subunit-like protein
MRVLIFDTETTGLPKTKLLTKEVLHLLPFIVQLSYVIFNTVTNRIEVIQDHIINIPLDIQISPESTNIHGITKEITLSKGKALKDILFQFIEDYESCDLLVGHNLSFDVNMLKMETMRLIQTSLYFEKLYLEEFLEKLIMESNNNSNSNSNSNNSKHYCTMKKTITYCNLKVIDKKGKEYIKFPKLSELHKKMFGYIPKNLHNSLHDVLVCLRCFYQIEYKTDLLIENKKVRNLFVKLRLQS